MDETDQSPHRTAFHTLPSSTGAQAVVVGAIYMCIAFGAIWQQPVS